MKNVPRAVGPSLIASAAVLGILLGSSDAHATHFRYGNITYERVDPINSPNTVRFTLTVAWRSTFIDSLSLDFGDGVVSPAAQGVQVATGVDAAGLQYAVMRSVVTHTYPSTGVFTASASSCCRLSNLVNAADDSFRVEAKVDLTGTNTGNPITYLPAIIQLQTGGIRSHFIPAADPDGTPVTCRFSTPTEAGDAATVLPPLLNGSGAAASLSNSANPPGCMLTWNTTGGMAGQQYAVQVLLESPNPSNSTKSTAVNDYIIELVSSPPPTCVGSATYTIPVGTQHTATMTGTNSSAGLLAFSPLYQNGSFTPPGGNGPSPFQVTHTWTPGPAEHGTALVTGVFTNAQNISGYCTQTLIVPSCPSYGTPCSAGVGECQNPGIIRCQANGTTYCDAVAGQPVAELCNGLDDNCDGTVDEGNPESGQPCTSTSPGVCAAGLSDCSGGVLQCIAGVSPGTQVEQCNGLDDDCNGVVDDGFNLGAVCTNGVGACQTAGVIACVNAASSACDAVAGLPSSEICDGLDNNCDGVVDEGFNLGATCVVAPGPCEGAGTIVCDGMGAATCSGTPGQGSTEICGNNVDEDCDGVLDNGCECVSDADCPAPQIGTVCSASTFTCVAGCRGVGGNGCPGAQVCTSTTTAVGQCVDCTSDAQCGSVTSGKVCSDSHQCINGCRGMNGNGCPDGFVCTSTGTNLGNCEPSNTGGTAGTGSTGAGGTGASGAGGTAGSAGVGGSGGTNTGGAGASGSSGSAGSSGTAGTGGTAGSVAGTSGSAGTSTSSGDPPAANEGGCCSVPGQRTRADSRGLVAVLGAALLGWRRRRAKSREIAS